MTMTAAAWLMRLATLKALVNVVGPQDREHDDQHDQAEDGRQRADVAAADPVDVLADALAEAALGSAGVGGGVLLGPARWRSSGAPPSVRRGQLGGLVLRQRVARAGRACRTGRR